LTLSKRYRYLEFIELITLTSFEYCNIFLSPQSSLISRTSRVNAVGGFLRNWYSLPLFRARKDQSTAKLASPDQKENPVILAAR